MNEDERNIRYSVYHGNDMLIDNEQMISVDDAVRNIRVVCGNIIESQDQWQNFLNMGKTIAEEHTWLNPERWAEDRLATDIFDSIVWMKEDICECLTLELCTDDDPIMPLCVSVRTQRDGKPYSTDMCHVWDNVEDIMKMYNDFYRGMLDKYDGDDMSLEIKDKHCNVLCGKYGRNDVWKRQVDGVMVEYGDIVNEERPIAMSIPIYVSFDELLHDLINVVSDECDENEKD